MEVVDYFPANQPTNRDNADQVAQPGENADGGYSFGLL